MCTYITFTLETNPYTDVGGYVHLHVYTYLK